MEAAACTDPEAWQQQGSLALKRKLSSSSQMPQGKILRTAKIGQILDAGTSKSAGKEGDQPKQVEGGAEAPPKEIPPSPSDPQPSTSKDPTNAPAVIPTQDPTEAKPQEPEKEAPPELTEYVKSYRQAGKAWLDTVLDQKEQACITPYDRLRQIGDKHKEHLDQAVRDQVLKSIRDKSGKCLSEDDFATSLCM